MVIGCDVVLHILKSEIVVNEMHEVMVVELMEETNWKDVIKDIFMLVLIQIASEDLKVTWDLEHESNQILVLRYFVDVRIDVCLLVLHVETESWSYV